MFEIPLTQGKVALIDSEDFPLTGQFRWYAARHRRIFYAQRGIRKPDGSWTVQQLHQVIMGFTGVDHVNGDGLDNRRANLRPASALENNRNKGKTRGGSSPYKGVSWYKRGRCWRAFIYTSGHQISLGSHRDETSAALAYDDAARLHFGPFAALNFPRSGERSAQRVLIGA